MHDKKGVVMRLGIIMLAATLLAFPAYAQVTKKEDRFTGNTTFAYESKFSIKHHDYVLMPASLFVHATYASDKPESFSMMILTNSSIGRSGRGGWRYLGVDNIHWLVDGKPFQLPQVVTQRNTQRGFVTEAFVQPLTREHARALGAASSVEFRIGQDEFQLSENDFAGLAEIASTEAPE